MSPSQGTFEWDIFIERQPAEVLALLCDYNRLPMLHPLVIAVEQVDAPEGTIRSYKITDQLQWGVLRFRIHYQANILRINEHEIFTTATQSPDIHIENLSTVTGEQNGTRLKETVNVRAPWMLFNYTFIQAKMSHKTLLQRIKNVLEENRNRT